VGRASLVEASARLTLLSQPLRSPESLTAAMLTNKTRGRLQTVFGAAAFFSLPLLWGAIFFGLKWLGLSTGWAVLATWPVFIMVSGALLSLGELLDEKDERDPAASAAGDWWP